MFKRKRQGYYGGSLIREVCPSLLGKPIYDKDGNYIPYTLVFPKFRGVSDKKNMKPRDVVDLQFNKQQLVIINSLNQDEARAFVKFLESEIIRHRDDIIQAQELINQVIIRFGEIE